MLPVKYLENLQKFSLQKFLTSGDHCPQSMSRNVVTFIHKQNYTRISADAQRDDRPTEYTWCPLRKFRNSILRTTPQTLPDARCWSAVLLLSSCPV